MIFRAKNTFQILRQDNGKGYGKSRVRAGTEIPVIWKLGFGYLGLKKVGFGRELKSRVSGIFGFDIED